MTVEIEAAVGENRQIVRNLFPFYFHDMAVYDDGLSMNAWGLPVWTAFGGETPRTQEACVTYNWWIRDSCHLFVIRADGNPAGFAIVNPGPHFVAEGIDFDVQDFFIAAKYRRQGIGNKAAKLLFDRFRGQWEVFQLARNAPAIAFWHRVIGEYTNGNFQIFDDGARQRFCNARSGY